MGKCCIVHEGCGDTDGRQPPDREKQKASGSQLRIILHNKCNRKASDTAQRNYPGTDVPIPSEMYVANEDSGNAIFQLISDRKADSKEKKSKLNGT
jgi:hypothetical protein